MPNKAFLEITNACNLDCCFCHKTARPVHFMSEDEFTLAATRVRSFADYLYFHLMGEPLLHPRISRFFEIAADLGYQVIITTNGTLLDKCTEILLNAPALRKVSISLHSHEANRSGIPMEDYLNAVFDFCRKASEKGIISVMRLWNIGGEENKNPFILEKMKKAFGDCWKETYSGFKIREKLFLEWGERFDWPDIDGEYLGCDHTCYGLRDQIGILCDGSVVPCCLDADGVITLGNIFDSTIEEILESKRARTLKESLLRRTPAEPLCHRCAYARMKKY